MSRHIERQAGTITSLWGHGIFVPAHMDQREVISLIELFADRYDMSVMGANLMAVAVLENLSRVSKFEAETPPAGLAN
jgi:hypothetical protein